MSAKRLQDRARPAQPSLTFDFTYTFPDRNRMVTGSFTGDLTGDVVNNIANVRVFFDGVEMPGPIYTAKYNSSGVPNYWLNGAVVSFDVTKNNFIFANGDLTKGGGFNSYFFILDGSTSHKKATTYSAPLAKHDSALNPTPAQWTLAARDAFGVQAVRRLRARK